MARLTPLPVNKLTARLDPAAVKHDDTSQVRLLGKAAEHQPRAVHALELGLFIKNAEYHIYLSGEPGLGRTYFLKNLLEPRARASAAPADLVYVHNFDEPDRPRLIELEAGRGRKLRADMAETAAKVRESVAARLEQEAFFTKRQSLIHDYNTRRDALYHQMKDTAAESGFAMGLDEEGAMTLAPVIEGRTVGADEFARLPESRRARLGRQRESLFAALTELLRKMQAQEREFKRLEVRLERDLVEQVLAERLDPLQERYADIEAVVAFLKDLRTDVLENLEQLLPREESCAAGQAEQHPAAQAEEIYARFQINLFVDNARYAEKGLGAPLVVEEHPTFFNLLGCIERESELGALYTDFSLIKAGSLHRANGGFLVLRAEDVLETPAAWEGLLRALRTAKARIEDPGEADAPRTRTIEPQPVELDLKVVLVGTDETYEALLFNEPRFRKLFKIKAHLQETVARTKPNLGRFFREVARIVEEAGLVPFDRTAMAGLADYSSRLAGDQRKLSLQYPLVRDLMIEASAMAQMQERAHVDAGVLGEARTARDYRANLYEDEFMADYDRQIIKVPTSGSAVGRVNGLSVTYFGDYVFALPHQIACTVGVGEGGIIDLEREAMLGGPIHTKAMMILKSYLLGRFAHDKPLILAGSLYFEQSYAHVEGDSASGAELAALLSALAEAPIDLGFAFTGAVNQSGAVMAVGDVTRKVEGFFEVCRRRGLTGRQGVLVPADNVVNLMLKDEVVRAVEEGRFAVYPVKTIEQAMEILTGLPAGRPGKGHDFAPNTLYRRVDERLRRLAHIAASFRGPRSTTAGS